MAIKPEKTQAGSDHRRAKDRQLARARGRPGAEGRRRIVLATAIAETSLTLEGVSVVVDAGLKFSNGVTLSPDQSLLYVADSKTHWVYSYQIGADGVLLPDAGDELKVLAGREV